MNSLQKKQLAFLEETVAHYNSTNRCAKNVSCKYSPKSVNLEGISEGCAIGRKLDPEIALKIDQEYPTGVAVSNPKVYKQLPEDLQKLGRKFLVEIQTLHDKSRLWNVKGITDEGIRRVNAIKASYGLEETTPAHQAG